MAVDALCDLHSAQGFGRSSKEISCMDGSPYKLTKVLPISDPLKFPVQSVQGPLKEHTYMPEMKSQLVNFNQMLIEDYFHQNWKFAIQFLSSVLNVAYLLLGK